ncbi:hypothetical protein [Roseixanthobacter glucoisosaccharinicivorans]|uniref:hypothetical protein n=1 Tax=Roseixanthobacter glucoisosaccharinicivorans TaxID=3119923 RepID=UPI003729BFDD
MPNIASYIDDATIDWVRKYTADQSEWAIPRIESEALCATDALVGAWDSFEETYISLQRLWVLYKKSPDFARYGRIYFDNSMRKTCFFSFPGEVVRIKYLLDIDLAIKDDILIEDEVMSLVNFRRAIDGVLKLDNLISYIDFGCVTIGLSVRVPLLLAEYFGDSHKAVFYRLQSESWEEAKKRFNVIQEMVIDHL